MFVGGRANQWKPKLFGNTTRIHPPTGQEGCWNRVTAAGDCRGCARFG
jgi:hypothetical protein